MTEELTPNGPPDEPALNDQLSALLAEPAVWGNVDPSGVDAIIATITAERDSLAEGNPGGDSDTSTDRQPTNVVGIDTRRRRIYRTLAAAAAVLIVVAGAAFVLTRSDSAADATIALAGTDVAPAATADADIANRPNGTRIDLQVDGLEPAPDGFYYEAWLRKSPEVGVSAGTFHLRGGDGSIQLWAGVALDEYPILTVTLQTEGGGAASSGIVVLAGKID